MPGQLPLKWSAAGVALVCACARLPWILGAGGQAHLALAQELAFALGAAAVAALAFRARVGLARDRVTLIVALVVGVEILSALAATNRWAAMRSSTMLIGGALVFLVARRTGASAALLVVPAVVAGSVILEAYGAIDGLSRSGHAPGGVVGERNAASELLVCVLPFVVATALRDRRSWVRIAAAVISGAAAAAIVLSRTRSAWLALGALAVLALVLVLRASDEVRSRAAPLVACAVIGAGLAALLPNALAWTEADPYRATLARLVDRGSVSGHGRWVQYSTTFRMALAHPLVGVGPGNWAGQYLAFSAPGDPSLHGGLTPTNRVPQSDVVGFAAERGFVAVGLVIALGFELLRARGEQDAAGWLRRATVLAVVVVGSFDAALQVPSTLFSVAIVVGSSSQFGTNTPSTRSWPLVVGAGVLAGASVFAALRVAAFGYFVRASGFADYERAVGFDPGDVAQRVAVASDYVAAGRCADAQPHLAAARRLAVLGPEAEALGSCRGQR